MNKKAHIVIGTGRSGTSLVTQALTALGVTPPQDPVPPSENNLRGTGEAIAVRNQMIKLRSAFGDLPGFRPQNWQDLPASRDTLAWISEYLSAAADRAGDNGFFVKFPLASMFLPLWQQAGQNAGVDLRFIWASRGAAATCHSLQAAYQRNRNSNWRIYVQRCYYILRDAPDDTLVLPYEGWQHNPAAQVAALAQSCGITDPIRHQAALDSYQHALNHSSAPAETEIPEAVAALDAVLSTRRGSLAELLDRSSRAHLLSMSNLADLLIQLQAPSPFGHSDDSHEMRLRLLASFSHASEQEPPEMNEQIDILTQRIRDVSAENRALTATQSAAPAQPAGNTTSDPAQDAAGQQLVQTLAALREAQSDLLNAHAQSLATQRARLQELTEENDRLLALSQSQDNSLLALRQENDDLAAQLQAASGTDNAETIETLRNQLAAQTAATEAAEAAAAQATEAYARLTAAHDQLEEQIEGRLRHQLQTLETREARARLQADRHQKELQKRTARLDVLQAELQEKNQRIKQLSTDLKAAKQPCPPMATKLQEDNSPRYQALQRELEETRLMRDELLNSTSWKITAPLRRIVVLARAR